MTSRVPLTSRTCNKLTSPGLTLFARSAASHVFGSQAGSWGAAGDLFAVVAIDRDVQRRAGFKAIEGRDGRDQIVDGRSSRRVTGLFGGAARIGDDIFHDQE